MKSMIRQASLTLLVSLLAFINPAIAQPGDERAVAAVLDAWHAAAATADEDAYFSHFTPDAVFLGTDATERWTVVEFRAFAHPYFAKGKAWTFLPRDRHISFSPDSKTAWFDEALDSPHMGPCRGSGVLVLTDAWRISQYNLSIPIPNDLCKDFVARIADYAAAHPTNGAGTQIHVVTFNIRYDNKGDGDNRWDKRRDNVVAFLRDQHADVIGLQEALHSQLQYIADALPEMGVLGVGRDDGKTKGEYSAILYRKDRWRPAEDGHFWFSDTPEAVGSKSWGNHVVRICTWARFVPVKDTDKGSFYHFNLHIDHESQPSRERSVVLLLDRIGARAHPDPVVVTGDFNSGEDNLAVKAMKGDVPLADLAPNGSSVEHNRIHFTDSFRALHPDEKTVGTFNDFRGRTDGPKIDYIFIAPGIRATEASIHRLRPGDRDLSDHFPVSATLTLPAR